MKQIADVERIVRHPRRTALPQSTLPYEVGVPLIVDLDGTLLAVDTLTEGLRRIAIAKPFRLPELFSKLSKGRVHLKEFVQVQAQLDARTLPKRQDVLELIAAERAAGRKVHLVTAAPQCIADAVGADLQMFDSVIGTSDGTNLKGGEKLARMQALFGPRFLYAGDADADTPIFHAAEGAILVGAAAARREQLERAGVVVAGVLSADVDQFSAWARLLRIKHWSKNLVIAAPLFLSQQFWDLSSVVTVLAAFLVWNLLASGTYILNDVMDLDADRQHPTKRLRPLAAGKISLLKGSLTGAGLIGIALVASWFFPPAFAASLAAYLVLTLCYSMALKRIPLMDVNVIGILFTLRVIAGMAVLELPVSLWLVSFSAALFTSLALAKRHAELARLAASNSTRVTGRGYQVQDLSATLAFGVAYALSAALIMLLYFNFEANGKGLYQSVEWLYVIPAILLSWLSRVWLLANRGTLEDDPVNFALRDASSWVHAAGFLFAWMMAVWA